MKFLKLAWFWKLRFFRTLHRDAAIDSLRNVLAVIGFGTLIGDFSQMRLIFVIPALCLFYAVWFADYLRHFTGESSEDSCARELRGSL